MFARRLLPYGLMLAVAFGANGCAEATEGVGDEISPKDVPTTVRIENNNWSDITVYAIRNGSLKIRLGLVPSMQNRTFALSKSVTVGEARLRLLADPVGSTRAFFSPHFVLWPGDTADWKLQNHLALSSLAVH